MSFITFKTIGEAGNLGSQMQQYASLLAVARNAGKTIVFPESSLNMGYGFKFAEAFDIEIKTMPDSFFDSFIDIRPDDRLLVDSSLFQLMADINYNVVNRFDLCKYWHPSHTQEVESWTWNGEHLKKAEKIYQAIKMTDKETVALHVRRGDYLLPQHDHFCKLDNTYYGQALSIFFNEIDRYQFVIFSNDIQWCKEHLIEESEIVNFIEPSNDYVDMILMSLCDHQIIANSSYSWWAAFKNKNKNKQVVCPVNYLKSYSPWAHINGNYYPADWISINNESK
jgi:hypothetical protein